MKNHILKINRTVEELRLRTPKHESFLAIRSFMEKGKHDYYMALDLLGPKLGIKGVAHQAIDEMTGQHVGWIGCVQYDVGNPLNQIEAESSSKLFPDPAEGYTDCCVYVAKKQVQALMKVQNLADYILGNKKP